MAERIYNDEARYDPEILQEVQCDLLEAATIGASMIGLANQLKEVSTGLRPSIVPSMEETIIRIRCRIDTLQGDLDSTFGNMADQAVNAIYLGNLAAYRYGVTVQE